MNEHMMNPEPVVEPNAPKPVSSNLEKAQQLSEKAQQLKSAAGEKAQQFKQVAEDKACQIKSTAEEKAVALKQEASQKIDVTKEKAKQVQSDLEDYIKENPTKSALIAVGVGFFAGLLLKK